ncbi:Gfo/Idh/MocA family protein [Dactylosporangium matsuzakiense]|uniref:Oxidoreductase n=1 Tax=Dactylosporangium matsuzakiense TaxID=53360 RepID=A0A9W6KLT6_9ACTN|nr:Gfo/Idh/MocA family oxidoreductase [Dactylosporangium matsuzakiense]UWZ45919.1 Gfo/Idh/MocA family oxidoreductase [Dactylosporangium matsuzakiense]GLL02914.1 oxidoreductase [Dactylosporangium matsuzakiense]
MSDTTLRVGLIGYGLAGSAFHAPLISTTPGLDLAAIVTADPGRRQAAAQRYPHSRIVERAEDLWAAGDLDAVVIAAPNRTHVPLARAALDAGLAVVVDKPFAPSSADGEELARLAAERDLLLTVYQNRRWDGDFRTVRKLVEEGAFGRVLRLESRFDRWRPVPKGGWRESGDPAEAGGLLYDLGSHLVDQALQLSGPAIEVYCELHTRRAGLSVDDDTFVALRHDGDVRSHLWMNALAAAPAPRLRVLGDRGAYTKYGLDVQEDALRAGRLPGEPGWGQEPDGAFGVFTDYDGQSHTVPTLPGAYPDFYAGLAAALAGDAPAPVDVHDSIAVLKVLEAARRSAQDREVVRL